MRKMVVIFLLFVSLLSLSVLPRRVGASSVGYEHCFGDVYEVFVQYFPVVPCDSAYPTTSEEFPIRFYIVQKDWWLDPIAFYHVVPVSWKIDVFFRDDTTGINNWMVWQRWLPVSMTQCGMVVSWSLSVGASGIGIGASVKALGAWSIETDYSNYSSAYNGKVYRHLSGLKWTYNSNYWWFGEVVAEGAGVIGIPNDLALKHLHDHVEFLVLVSLEWKVMGAGGELETRFVSCLLGDDNPSAYDCWLTVEQGRVDFSLTPVIYWHGSRCGTTVRRM